VQQFEPSGAACLDVFDPLREATEEIELLLEDIGRR